MIQIVTKDDYKGSEFMNIELRGTSVALDTAVVLQATRLDL